MGVECFKPFASEGKTITLRWHSATETHIGLIVTMTDKAGEVRKPLTIIGTYKEVTDGFLTEIKRYEEHLAGFTSNIASLEQELEAQKKIKEAEVQKAKKAKSASCQNTSRLTAELDMETAQLLIDLPAGDANFKSKCKAASLTTLLRGLDLMVRNGYKKKGNWSKLADEIKIITGKGIEAYGFPAETATGKQASLFENGQRLEHPSEDVTTDDEQGYTESVDEETEEEEILEEVD